MTTNQVEQRQAKKWKPLVIASCGLAALVCVATSSCSSVRYNEDVAQIADSASLERLTQHMKSLTSIGPRRAGDAAAQQQTVDYLEKELGEMGLETEREDFELTPSSKLVVLLETDTKEVERWQVPGIYFGQTIGQVRVVRGLLEAAGVADRFAGYSLEQALGAPVAQANLIVTFPGTVAPEKVLEISAHHDTVPGTVGADDNTSGVVVLLEVARLLKENPPACSVRLCFFAAEEIGLLGSKEHVRLLQERGQIDEVFALINLDGVGHFTDKPDSQFTPIRIPLIVWPPKVGNFLCVIGANGSGWLGDLVIDAGALYTPDLATYSLARLGGFFPDARRSDHAHYWDLGIPAIFLSDTSEFRTDHYHRPGDDLNNVDLDALRDVAALVFASAVSATANEADQ